METEKIESKVSELLSMPLWGIRRGIGTFLTFEAGRLDRERSSEGVDHGEWHLWVRMAFWRVIRGSRIIASAMEDEDDIDGRDDIFDGQRSIIESVTVGRAFHDLSIRCSEGLAIEVFVATSRPDDEQWAIYFPDRQVISTYGDGRIVIGK